MEDDAASDSPFRPVHFHDHPDDPVILILGHQ
jgi:hypothetical protein